MRAEESILADTEYSFLSEFQSFIPRRRHGISQLLVGIHRRERAPTENGTSRREWLTNSAEICLNSLAVREEGAMSSVKDAYGEVKAVIEY